MPRFDYRREHRPLSTAPTTPTRTRRTLCRPTRRAAGQPAQLSEHAPSSRVLPEDPPCSATRWCRVLLHREKQDEFPLAPIEFDAGPARVVLTLRSHLLERLSNLRAVLLPVRDLASTVLTSGDSPGREAERHHVVARLD